MNVIVRRVIEIAGGLVIGSLAHDAVNGVGKLAKKAVVKVTSKAKEPKKA